MKKGFRWCSHCGTPHGLAARFCPIKGVHLDARLHEAKLDVIRPGTILGGKYRIVEVIGSGGMGTVFEAISLPLQRPVAVKVVSQHASADATERLLREVRILTKLQHPNICDVYDVGSLADGTPYLVLARLMGMSLGSHLARDGRLPVAEAVDVFVQVLSGLYIAHSRQILHRDLKPHNIFLSPRVGCSPLATIVDFGLALDLGDVRITRPGRACGTAHYMSPEQLRNDELDARSDIFSAAVALYEAITGKHPFVGGSYLDTRVRILRNDPVPLRRRRPSAPAALEAAIHWALEKDPARRPFDALIFQQALLATVERADPLFATDDEDPTSTRPIWRPAEISPSPE